MTLLEKLKELNFPEEMLSMNSISLQLLQAPQLRRLAIQFLAKSNHPKARSFRGEAIATGLGEFKYFLSDQAKDKTWGTYLEAEALAALFDVNLVVTTVKNNIQQKPICLHRAESNTAPTIHLYNSNNTHWYVNQQTIGDGNCLYNAFAQALQTTAQQEAGIEAVATPAACATTQGLFHPQPRFIGQKVAATNVQLTEQSVIQHQRDIADAIQLQPKPSELAVQFEAERARISKLPSAEQQQISSDYQLALRLAREDMSLPAQPARSPLSCAAEAHAKTSTQQHRMVSY